MKLPTKGIHDCRIQNWWEQSQMKTFYRCPIFLLEYDDDDDSLVTQNSEKIGLFKGEFVQWYF